MQNPSPNHWVCARRFSCSSVVVLSPRNGYGVALFCVGRGLFRLVAVGFVDCNSSLDFCWFVHGFMYVKINVLLVGVGVFLFLISVGGFV
jgi:hypothetical protein